MYTKIRKPSLMSWSSFINSSRWLAVSKFEGSFTHTVLCKEGISVSIDYQTHLLTHLNPGSSSFVDSLLCYSGCKDTASHPPGTSEAVIQVITKLVHLKQARDKVKVPSVISVVGHLLVVHACNSQVVLFVSTQAVTKNQSCHLWQRHQ